jgi:hypothetical protein
MATPTLISRARATVISGAANTTLSIANPAALTAGRMALFKLHCSATLNPNSVTPPAGLTLIAQNFNGNGASVLHSWYGYAFHTGAEPANWDFTFGSSGNDDELIVEVWEGVNPTNPIGTVSAISNALTLSPVCPTITTVGVSSIVLFEVASKNGNSLTAANSGYPTDTTGIASDRTRANSAAFQSGSAYQSYPTAGAVTGTKTWTNYTLANQVCSTVSYELRGTAAAVVDSVDGSTTPVLKPGQTKTLASTGLGAVTAVALTSAAAAPFPAVSIAATNVSAPAGDGSFDVPARVDAALYPYVGNLTIAPTDGSITASLTTATFALEDGMAQVILASLVTDVPSYLHPIFLAAGTTIVDNDVIYNPTANGLVLDPDGKINVTTLPLVATLWLHKLSDSKVYSYELSIDGTGTAVITGVAGISILNISIRALGISAITARGI